MYKSSSTKRRSVHEAWVKGKLCSFEGCTNEVVKIGVCIRHGAKKVIFILKDYSELSQDA